MAVKANPAAQQAAPDARDRPWLRSYPPGLSWTAEFKPGLVHSLLDEAVERHGSRMCTYFEGKTLTYEEIGALSDRAAKGLAALGVREGVRVGLLLPNSPTYLIYFFGILKAGGTVVNFNPLYSVEELAFQIRDSGTEIMVTLDLHLLFKKIEPLLADGTLGRAVVADFASLLPTLKQIGLMMTRKVRRAKVGLSRQRRKIVRERDLLANNGRFVRPTIKPEAVAVLQYTGGTTGTPKGAMLSHANIFINTAQVRLWGQRPPEVVDRILGVLPLFHVFAMTTVMTFGVANGMEIVLMPKFELGRTLKLIGKLRPTVMPGVPTLFQALLHHRHIDRFDLSSLQFCISGGAALPMHVKKGFEKFIGGWLVEGYGLSETSPVATCNPFDGHKDGSIGLPLPRTEITIRSLENPEQEMPMGEPGEICIAGPQVMSGYWNKADETAAVFVGKYFRTGDVGYMDEDGFIFIVDRIKDMINTAGFKVYPRRIEDALHEHPAVAECCVVGIPDSYRGEAPKAYVRLHDGRTETAVDLMTFLRPKLSKLELPVAIEFRDELPKTMIGKLSKKALRAETGA
ncbi:long-chain fatty acid--CoA ligase [Methyloceanibacter sp. wino2]|uniref:long-chain-fatty-acid--CoA ligase n=1 Tax=Methyloceanibacter sp. wino2 TaxID=2170729 RepID=UPI000D3E090E|nr:long-chain fatty acid--CoA ligase [Methyloceanibacter sp. wino2]